MGSLLTEGTIVSIVRDQSILFSHKFSRWKSVMLWEYPWGPFLLPSKDPRQNMLKMLWECSTLYWGSKHLTGIFNSASILFLNSTHQRVYPLLIEFMASEIRGCLLVRQSFFHDDPRNFTDIGGSVTRCQGLYSSFRATHGGLSLNMGITLPLCSFVVTGSLFLPFCWNWLIVLTLLLCSQDVSATMIVTPGPVIDFLLAKQDAKKPCDIDWAKEVKLASYVSYHLFFFVFLFIELQFFWARNRLTKC